MKKIKKILVIRLSSLGDVLLTYPLLYILKNREAESEIHFVVKEQFIDAIRTNPFIDKVLIFSKNQLKELKTSIKKNKYEVIIDLQNNMRSRLLYFFERKAKIYRFKKPGLKKFLLVNFKINLLKENPSISLQYIKTIYPDYHSKNLDLYFHIPQDIETKSLQKISVENLNRPTIGICPGSRHFTKRYPVEKFKTLIQKFLDENFSVALFGGKDDFDICKELKINPSVKNFQNENDLLETASIMKKCSLIITNDSGLMHLSSLLQIPTIAIFGSTVKEFGFFPIYNKSIVIENNNLKCRPCSHIGRSKCPEKHFKCMNDINPDLIFNKSIELIMSNQE
ncbi:MAG: glycosyltransferase family 9 protein [Ignavibacteria bacterium]